MKQLKPQGGTNFKIALTKAFDALDQQIENEAELVAILPYPYSS
jgi:hypothetical protein